MTAVEVTIKILKQELDYLLKCRNQVGNTPWLMAEFEFKHRQLTALQGE